MFSAQVGALAVLAAVVVLAGRWSHWNFWIDYFFRRPRIFISYRREDLPDVAALVYRTVVDEYKRVSVFLDVDAIVAGDDFPQAIRKSIDASDLVIAIVGPRWIGPVSNGEAPRIQREDEFVRLELEEAIRAGKRLMVLHWGQQPPAAETLPRCLNRVLLPKWINVSEELLGPIIRREMTDGVQCLSWIIPISMFSLQMAAWLTAVAIATAIYWGAALKRADAVEVTPPRIENRQIIEDQEIFLKNHVVVSITADNLTYVFNQVVPLPSVANEVRAILSQCQPACERTVLIRADRQAKPAAVFAVARQLKESNIRGSFVTQAEK